MEKNFKRKTSSNQSSTPNREALLDECGSIKLGKIELNLEKLSSNPGLRLRISNYH